MIKDSSPKSKTIKKKVGGKYFTQEDWLFREINLDN